MVADPPVPLLNDSTSALDAETRGRAAIDALYPSLTRLIVSHRADAARDADRVVVLDAGRVVEQGPPVAFLARGGAFAGLHAEPARPLVIGPG